MNKVRGDNMQEPRRSRPRHPVGHFLVISLLGLFLVLGAYAFRMYADTRSAIGGTFQQLQGRNATEKIKDEKPISFLLIGTDTGALGRTQKGNADTLIVVTVNPKKKKTTMVSIPRDTLADIQNGSQTPNFHKINASYLIGGSETTVKTVETLLNIPIDYYVTVNMGGLSDIVDAVGGIDVNVPFAWNDTKNGAGIFTKGPAHLDGQRALQFARMRHEDPEGDYGRQKRQQTVIKAIMKKVLNASTLTNYKPLLQTLKGNMQMNLSFDDLMGIGTNSNYRAALQHLKRDQLKGVGAYIDGASYQVTKTSELQRVSDLINTQLGKETETVDNQVTHQNDLNTTFDWSSGYNPVFHIYAY
ncbi:LCP family protein [Lacticaseibacillus hulanensis]|uniref:LCP family protein n=1 Tax=Lacticaseibacillus hulanensis TaxID=2493111 RepID=UPI000FDBA86E|nr:LCP family protein [Lacticaseibacillus hulanensis]